MRWPSMTAGLWCPPTRRATTSSGVVAQADPAAGGNGGPAAVEFWPQNMYVSSFLFGLEGTGPAWENWLREPPDAEREAYDREQERSEERWRTAVDLAARHNLGVVMERMALDAVQAIEIEVAGESDDGAVQAVRLLPGGNLNAQCAGLRGVRWDEGRDDWVVTERDPETFGALIRHVAWNLLQARFPGWWNDLGGSGTLRITAEGMEVHFRRGVEEFRDERYIETPAAVRPAIAGPGEDGPQP